MHSRLGGIGMTSQRTRVRMIERLRKDGIKDEVVLSAIGEIPRHIFVDEALASRAYEDMSLPLGFGQTISSPFVVARMCELARAGKKLNKVLEIGGGCGYQTAILSRLANEVYSVERVASLLYKARGHLRELRVGNAKLKHADGYFGYTTAAPFDAIILAAAAAHVPDELKEQIILGGRMVLPKGSETQHLCVIERTADEFVETILNEVKFVLLVPGIV